MQSNTKNSCLLAIAFCSALLTTAFAAAADLQVTVLDSAGKGLREVVVIATPTAPQSATHSTATAVMDQVDKQFVPEVLVVRVGTSVSFPNSDSVAHQVYSFSLPKRFELPLYRGRAHPPVVFDQPGVVALGCNIHDHMAGYIYVTASPYFGKTDTHGRVLLRSLPAGTYRVSSWSPYLSESLPEQELTITAQQTTELQFALRRNLRPQRPPIDPRIRDY